MTKWNSAKNWAALAIKQAAAERVEEAQVQAPGRTIQDPLQPD